MSKPFTQPQLKTKTSILLFIKGSSMPMVLYFENPAEQYEQFQQIIKTASTSPKLIEKETIGPIKKFSVLSSQIAAVAMQEEQYTV